MENSDRHLYLFVNGLKRINPYSRRYLEILVKDKNDNLISMIREDAALENKDIQDYSALLLALRKARGLGANNITLFLDNSELCSQLNDEDYICYDNMLDGFFQEAKELIGRFDSVTVKMA